MIRKLLYRFRRQVLVWQVDWIWHRMKSSDRLQYRLYTKLKTTKAALVKLDATEMSKGEAHVVVRCQRRRPTTYRSRGRLGLDTSPDSHLLYTSNA